MTGRCPGGSRNCGCQAARHSGLRAVVENVRVAELARRAELARDVGGLVRQEWKDDETTKEEAPTVAAGPVCAEV